MGKTKEWNTKNKGVSLNVNSMGIHFERMDEFEKSYYKSVYKNAFLQLDDIINQHSIWRQWREREEYAEPFSARLDFGYERFSNILTFVGGRGAGKTSVMLSFMNALKDYYVYYTREESGSLFYSFENRPKILFTCLNCIDGSLLEHGEDIFKIVLAQMYQKFIDLERKDSLSKSDDFDYRKRELLKELEEIYKTVCEIERMENDRTIAGESYMSNLQSLSSSQKVKKDFGALIKKFTALMKYKRDRWIEAADEHYVVITVDDIDLNIKNGFSMLEKIHRYCMVPNVVVLLSVDMEQMLSIAFQNFYEILPKVDKVLRKGEKRIRRVSMEYLDKVMPVNYRIYLPEIAPILSDKAISVEKEQTSVKAAILGKLYRRSGICFDALGKKRHFYEPKSMRQLTSFYLLLDFMDCVKLEDIYFQRYTDSRPGEVQEQIDIWENNCRILVADLSNRMVFEKVYGSSKLFDWYTSLMREDIRCAKNQVAEFLNSIKNKRKKKSGWTAEDLEKDDEKECSYGEFIEALYELGRIDKEKYKPLVHCLLAYFSYAFTKQYVFERLALKNEDGSAKAKSGSFAALMGKDIVNQWTKDMLPKVPQYRAIEQGTDETIAIRNMNKKEFVQCACSNSVSLTSLFTVPLDDPNDRERFPDDAALFHYAAGMIQNIEIWMLFFNNIRMDANTMIKHFPKEFHIKMNMKNHYELFMEQKSYVGDFNVLNFVINSMSAFEKLGKLEKALYDCLLKEYLSQRDEKGESWEEDFADIMRGYSLKNQYEAWERKFGENSLPLPVYWVDMTYNVLKRTRKDLLEKNIKYSTYEEMYFYIQRLCLCIIKQLRRQDQFYGFGEGNNVSFSTECDRTQYSYHLKDRFQECPFVQYFQCPGGETKRRRVDFIANSMMRLREFYTGV